MSVIALPDFMARTSLKKPLEQAPQKTTTAVAGRQSVGGKTPLRAPRYRIRFAQPGLTPRPGTAGRALPRHAAQRDSWAGEQDLAVQKTALAASGGSGGSAKGGALRLTRKGRLVFRGIPALTVAVLILLGALTFLNPGEAKGSTAETSTAVSASLTVMHGDSLWDIAAKIAPDQDNRDVINQIMQINDLTTAQVKPGQVLEVPVYTSK